MCLFSSVFGIEGFVVAVDKVLYSRSTGVETWITSDGRAYFVRLLENTDAEASTSEPGIVEEGTLVLWLVYHLPRLI